MSFFRTRPKLPEGYSLIGKDRHEQLTVGEFNPALDGMESESRFSETFNDEIQQVMTACSKFLAQHGEFGSYQRSKNGLASDWWISDDFYSVSRVLHVDLLDSRMQTYSIVQGLREILVKLPSVWMLAVGHENAYDNRGQWVGKPGEYCFWIRRENVEIYSKRGKDVLSFFESLRLKS